MANHDDRHRDQHYALVENCAQTWLRCLGEELILECDQVIVLREVNQGREYADVIYFPESVVEALNPVASATRSFCPIKGYASYWSYRDLQDCIWSYPQPMPGVAAIGHHYAFDLKQGFRVAQKT